MTTVKSIAKNNKFLLGVIFLYGILGIFMPDKALLSIGNSLYYVKEMLMIMPVILLLTALITAWIPQDAIQKNLGKNSGIKGSLFSFLLGSFSAGPIYAAFPVCKALLAKGASISNIVVLLSTWAVLKVPMLVTEAKFLGPKFMATRWVLTTVAIFLMGYITSRFVKEDDLPADSLEASSGENKLSISTDYCIGCGLCARISPNHFEMINRKAMVINQDINSKEMGLINDAINQCPPKIIGYH